MYQRNGTLVRRISCHYSRREILPSACQRNAKARKSAKFVNKTKMAAACSAAVVSSLEELADDSVLQEASSCEDK